jgi:hypothetical protein
LRENDHAIAEITQFLQPSSGPFRTRHIRSSAFTSFAKSRNSSWFAALPENCVSAGGTYAFARSWRHRSFRAPVNPSVRSGKFDRFYCHSGANFADISSVSTKRLRRDVRTVLGI